MKIRRAQETDLEAIDRLLYQVNMVHYKGRPDLFKAGEKKYTDQEFRELLQDESRPVFVAVDEKGNVQGYAFCIFQQKKNHNILTDIRTLYIDDLCVDEACRGQHIGSALYEYVKAFAKEQGCAIVIVHHMNKAIGQKALNRSVGSVDIVGAARSVLLVGRTDKDRPDERILAQVKSNLAPTGNAILFSVDESGVKWLEETARTADEVLGNVFAQAGRPDGQMQKAKEMLSALLADGTPKPQSEVMEKLTAAGVGKSTATKAKALLGIRSVKQGMQWFWVLPDSEE